MAIGSINDERSTSDIDAVSAERRKQLESFLDAELDNLHLNALASNLVSGPELCEAIYKCISLTTTTSNDCECRKTGCYQTAIPNNSEADGWNLLIKIVVIAIICLLISSPIAYLAEYVLGTRCFLPNNYLIWEATRPISDCSYCKGVNRPLILKNMTQDEFQPFAYSSKPIIMKSAVSHWPAKRALSFEYLRQLYLRNPLALDTFDEECQFLQFQSKFASLRQLFDSVNVDDGKNNASTEKPSWYVGFSNCQITILNELRQLYPRPHFLPEDAEIPNTDYIFLGYDQGAVMHLDYIPRLMWQAQLQGNKTWMLSPSPECDSMCSSFSFYVEPGDAVLIDTRIWYHGTSVSNGQFSLTIQSEYG